MGFDEDALLKRGAEMKVRDDSPELYIPDTPCSGPYIGTAGHAVNVYVPDDSHLRQNALSYALHFATGREMCASDVVTVAAQFLDFLVPRPLNTEALDAARSAKAADAQARYDAFAKKVIEDAFKEDGAI